MRQTYTLFGERARPVMLIWSPQFAVVPATIHVPLARVPALLTRELLVETGVIVAQGLASRFGIKNPRLAFTGLNPHAGEGGTVGREEIEIVAPALADLAASGVAVSGPHAADSLFRPGARKNYDAVVAMYHDQALIPVKTVAFARAVNVTLGLPLIRTSPDHGTAFDIAGTGIADPASLIAALRLAGKLAREMTARSIFLYNPKNAKILAPTHPGEPARRPSAAARGRRRAWALGKKIPRSEFSFRS